jgi:ABC-2 type transport system permease protein
MTRVLVRKLLGDLRVGLIVVCLLLFLFQLLWAQVSRRISGQILQDLQKLLVTPDIIRNMIFQGPGQIIQAIMGGEDIKIERAQDLVTIAYVHPLTLIILCVWAIGRSSGAIAGEIDRGTMELLLAQPIRRSEVIRAHLLVDLITIPLLCLSMWAGTWVGTWLVGLQDDPNVHLRVAPERFLPGLVYVFSLVLAVSGYTMCLSALGRFRYRVLGWAIVISLVQFLINIIGQLWDRMAWMRPATVFYHYQPQPLILQEIWAWQHLGVLLAVGVIGYLLALWKFCTRDLPAPL